MSEERRGPVLPDNTPIRRSSSNGRTTNVRHSSGSSSYRSSSQRSSTSRPSQRSSSARREEEYRSSRRPSSGNGSQSRNSGRKSGKRKMKSGFYFLCFMAVWILILLIFGAIFLGYADRSLKKFEKSQSTYAMEDYIKNFQKDIEAGNLPEGFSGEGASAFEPAETKLASIQNAIAGRTLSYQIDSSSYNTEEPLYDLLADGTPVAQIQLVAENARVVFGILTIMDWKVTDAKLLSSDSVSDYYISVPESYSVTVNGVPVGSEYLTDEKEDTKLFANAAEYVNIPETVKYKIPGLSNVPSVVVNDENGQSVEVAVNGNEFSVGYGGTAGEIPDDLKETALKIAQTWSLFMTDDLGGAGHGLSKVQEYLIPGSAYDDMAKGWAGGIDITFTSAHTLKNPAFENVVVDEYVSYTPECFSCHIYFDKPMHLTRTGENIVDTTNSTYLFVQHDGKWCLADMVAKTETGN